PSGSFPVTALGPPPVGSCCFFCRESQSPDCLESLSKKFKKDITDERGHHGNGKIRCGKDVSDRPAHAPLLPHPRALKLSHQEVGIKEEDDKSYFDHRSREILLHRKSTPGPLRCSRHENHFGQRGLPCCPLFVPLLRILAIIIHGQRKSGLGGRASPHGSVSGRGRLGAPVLVIAKCRRTHLDWPRKGHSAQIAEPPVALKAASALG